MTSPPSPLPSAVQHTRCWQAVTAIHAALDKLIPGLAVLDKHVSKIRRWLDLCEADIRTKRLSAGAVRETKAWCEVMESHLDLYKSMPGDELFSRWGTALVAAEIMLWDCRTLCPEWFRGSHWRYLLQTLQTLVKALITVDPALEEDGFSFYMEVA